MVKTYVDRDTLLEKAKKTAYYFQVKSILSALPTEKITPDGEADVRTYVDLKALLRKAWGTDCYSQIESFYHDLVSEHKLWNKFDVQCGEWQEGA